MPNCKIIEEEKIKLDPHGDITLCLKDKELPSSSKCLGLASPVFQKMFNSPFHEGREVSVSDPGRIDLSDDEPRAMYTLCSIIHFRVDNLPKILLTKSIEEDDVPHMTALAGSLVKFADKWDCLAAVTLWASTLVVALARCTTEMPHVGDLIYAAYELDIPDAFERLTAHLLLLPRDIYRPSGTPTKMLRGRFSNQANIGPAELPDGLFGKILAFGRSLVRDSDRVHRSTRSPEHCGGEAILD